MKRTGKNILLLAFTGIVILAFLVSSHNVTAVDEHLTTKDGWEWHYDSSDPTILTSAVYTGWNNSVIVPNSLDGIHPLLTIGVGAISNTILQKITFQDNITSFNRISFPACYHLSYIGFLGFEPSIDVNWLEFTYSGSTIQIHAYSWSNFPAPGDLFGGCAMGANIPQPSAIMSTELSFNSNLIVMIISFAILGILTYASFKDKTFFVINGFAWIFVAAVLINPIQYTLSLIALFIGIAFALWGVYRFIK